MRLAITVPEKHVSAPVLNAGLETNTRINEALLRDGTVPTFKRAVAAGRVRWQPEPPGEERFDHAQLVLGRGHGDCDDIAPWAAASYRVTGEDPGARSVAIRSGPNRWHAIVQRSSGALEDPSRDAGMGHKVLGVCGAVLPPMFRAYPGTVNGADAPRPSLAVRKWGPIWQGRVDLPWNQTDYALTALHKAPTASQAIVGAVYGACKAGRLSGVASPDGVKRLATIAGLLQGASPRELASVVGGAYVRGAGDLLNRCGDLFNSW
jgi:hypothetical protein